MICAHCDWNYLDKTILFQLTDNPSRNLFSLSQPLAIPGRVLVGEGVLTKMCRKRPKSRQFFLFNDILVYGNIVIGKKKYNKQHIIPLEEVQLQSLEDNGRKLKFITLITGILLLSNYALIIQNTEMAGLYVRRPNHLQFTQQQVLRNRNGWLISTSALKIYYGKVSFVLSDFKGVMCREVLKDKHARFANF